MWKLEKEQDRVVKLLARGGSVCCKCPLIKGIYNWLADFFIPAASKMGNGAPVAVQQLGGRRKESNRQGWWLRMYLRQVELEGNSSLKNKIKDLLLCLRSTLFPWVTTTA